MDSKITFENQFWFETITTCIKVCFSMNKFRVAVPRHYTLQAPHSYMRPKSHFDYFSDRVVFNQTSATQAKRTRSTQSHTHTPRRSCQEKTCSELFRVNRLSTLQLSQTLLSPPSPFTAIFVWCFGHANSLPVTRKLLLTMGYAK